MSEKSPTKNPSLVIENKTPASERGESALAMDWLAAQAKAAHAQSEKDPGMEMSGLDSSFALLGGILTSKEKPVGKMHEPEANFRSLAEYGKDDPTQADIVAGKKKRESLFGDSQRLPRLRRVGKEWVPIYDTRDNPRSSTPSELKAGDIEVLAFYGKNEAGNLIFLVKNGDSPGEPVFAAISQQNFTEAYILALSPSVDDDDLDKSNVLPAKTNTGAQAKMFRGILNAAKSHATNPNKQGEKLVVQVDSSALTESVEEGRMVGRQKVVAYLDSYAEGIMDQIMDIEMPDEDTMRDEAKREILEKRLAEHKLKVAGLQQGEAPPDEPALNSINDNDPELAQALDDVRLKHKKDIDKAIERNPQARTLLRKIDELRVKIEAGKSPVVSSQELYDVMELIYGKQTSDLIARNQDDIDRITRLLPLVSVDKKDEYQKRLDRLISQNDILRKSGMGNVSQELKRVCELVANGQSEGDHLAEWMQKSLDTPDKVNFGEELSDFQKNLADKMIDDMQKLEDKDKWREWIKTKAGPFAGFLLLMLLKQMAEEANKGLGKS